MAIAAEKISRLYIVARKGVCGGSPAVAGTKCAVRSVVNHMRRQGVSPEELVREVTWGGR